MKTTTNMVEAVEIHSMAGHFAKVVVGGRTVARADALTGGQWRIHTTGSGKWTEVTAEFATKWLALQAAVA